MISQSTNSFEKLMAQSQLWLVPCQFILRAKSSKKNNDSKQKRLWIRNSMEMFLARNFSLWHPLPINAKVTLMRKSIEFEM